MEPLVEISKKNWGAIQASFKQFWPHGLPGYYALKTQLDHPKLADVFSFRVFCPYGEFINGVIVINIKSTLYEVIILPTTDKTDKLEEALVNTKLIDWSKIVCVPFAEGNALRCLKRAVEKIGLKILREVPTFKHCLQKDTKPYENVVCPPNTYIATLKHENIPQVNNVWPLKHKSSDVFIKTLIDCGLTYALYSKEDDSLLAWLLICEVGFLTHLYCEEEHRGRGYAETVAKYVINDSLAKGNDVFCYILYENIKSLNLFRKLDFNVIGRAVWHFVTKHDTIIEMDKQGQRINSIYIN